MKTIKILLAGLMLSMAVVSAMAENASGECIREVLRDTCFQLEDSTRLYFKKGEKFSFKDTKKANLIYNDIALATDKAKIFGEPDTAKLTSRGLVKRLTIVSDTILKADFAAENGSDSVWIMNEKSGEFLIATKLGAKDSVLIEAGDTLSLRVIPQNGLSEVVNFAQIEKVAPKAGSTVVVTEEKGTNYITIILLAVLALLLIGAAAFFVPKFLKKNKGTGTEEDTENEPQTEQKEEQTEEKESVEETPEQLKRKIEELNSRVTSLEEEYNNSQEALAKEKASREEAIAKATQKAENKAKNDIAEAEAKAEKRVNAAEKAKTDAENRADKAKKEADATEQRVTERFNKMVTDLNKKVEDTQTELTETRNTLRNTQGELKDEQTAHAAAKREIERQKKEIERFDSRLGDAGFAQNYCREIEKLIKLADEIQASANKAVDANVEDPYFIFKAVARYSKQVGVINLEQFYTDVHMVSQTGFVPTGTPMATYDKKLPQSELEGLTRAYFFANYLKQYVNALVVLNESMAGLKYLVSDMPADLVRPFASYREQIQQIAMVLGISVVSVKIFDSIGRNTDLLATQVDAGFDSPGVILDIENCLVNIVGTPRDSNERIIVKVQS